MAEITLLLKASYLCDQLSINEWNDLIGRYEDDPYATVEGNAEEDVRIHTTFENVVSKNRGDLRFAKPILIRKNPNGDTRTAPKGITFKQFAKANDFHIGDVKAVMERLSGMIYAAGKRHDHTKKENEREFYDDFTATMNDGADFVNGTWYQRHVHTERHHPLSYCHDDINLLDILEWWSTAR